MIVLENLFKVIYHESA